MPEPELIQRQRYARRREREVVSASSVAMETPLRYNSTVYHSGYRQERICW